MKNLLIICIALLSISINNAQATDLLINLENKCNQSDAESCYKLGSHYYWGEIVKVDDAKASIFLEKACDSNLSKGCYLLGTLYDDRKDYLKAKDFFTKACSMGSNEGCSSLALKYKYGEGIPKDPKKAVDIYQKLCELKQDSSCVNAGYIYERGDGVSMDKAKAKWFYERACGGKNADGCFRSGEMYENGSGTAINITQALEYFKKACALKENKGCAKLKLLKEMNTTSNSVSGNIYTINYDDLYKDNANHYEEFKSNSNANSKVSRAIVASTKITITVNKKDKLYVKAYIQRDKKSPEISLLSAEYKQILMSYPETEMIIFDACKVSNVNNWTCESSLNPSYTLKMKNNIFYWGDTVRLNLTS